MPRPSEADPAANAQKNSPDTKGQSLQNSSDTTAAANNSAVTSPDKLAKLKVRTGGPLPPQILPETVVLDRSCRTNADCTVKDIGSCCGALPACVNRDSPTDAAAVQTRCASEGLSSACGFARIDSCRCVENECVADPSTTEPVGQPPEAN